MTLSTKKIETRKQMLPKEAFKYNGIYRGTSARAQTEGLHAVTDVDQNGGRHSACGLYARFGPTWTEWKPFALTEKTCDDCREIMG